MEYLSSSFKTRDEIIDYVQRLAPWANGPASSIQGGHTEATRVLHAITPIRYGPTRNFGDGAVTELSPYVTHGIIHLNDIREYALKTCTTPAQITPFIQQLSWRDFWHRMATQHPEWIWHDVEPYKTGFNAKDYATELPNDIVTAQTGVACLDAFIRALIETGHVHNHARMYLASYIVHFRRISWQTGARWFLTHLIDGDEASNNLSWQWIASTFSHKPYIFNLDNVAKYFRNVDTSPDHNVPLNATYATLESRLFPHRGARS